MGSAPGEPTHPGLVYILHLSIYSQPPGAVSGFVSEPALRPMPLLGCRGSLTTPGLPHVHPTPRPPPPLLERGSHPPQLVLDLPGVLLAGPLPGACPTVCCQHSDVSPAEAGDSLLELGLQLGVGGERVGVLLERMDLARHLGDVSVLGRNGT